MRAAQKGSGKKGRRLSPEKRGASARTARRENASTRANSGDSAQPSAVCRVLAQVGWQNVKAHRVIGGLVLHTALNSADARVNGPWRITHDRTGLIILKPTAQRIGEVCLRVLLAFGVPWQKDVLTVAQAVNALPRELRAWMFSWGADISAEAPQ